MASPDLSDSDPRTHTEHIRRLLDETARHARDDVHRVQDPRARALFETTAEVLDGLRKAYDDFDAKNEPAWQ